jgi:hypothetical protein
MWISEGRSETRERNYCCWPEIAAQKISLAIYYNLVMIAALRLIAAASLSG